MKHQDRKRIVITLPACPECGSLDVFSNGTHYVRGIVLRYYYCRDCGERFDGEILNAPDPEIPERGIIDN